MSNLKTFIMQKTYSDKTKSKIIVEQFPETQFYKEITKKQQIVLHHTVSNGQVATGDINTWLSDTARVATSMILTEDGKLHQCFDAVYWGHALGCKTTYLQKLGFKDFLRRNLMLNKAAIQIEIDSLGPVNAKGESIAYGSRLVAGEIQKYEKPYRGFQFYEKYTAAQLDTLQILLKDLSVIHEIPLTYHTDMWDVSLNALGGTPGVWTHTSYRNDKSDCHPQPELIAMLKSLQ